jgi:hypothetical protein
LNGGWKSAAQQGSGWSRTFRRAVIAHPAIANHPDRSAQAGLRIPSQDCGGMRLHLMAGSRSRRRQTEERDERVKEARRIGGSSGRQTAFSRVRRPPPHRQRFRKKRRTQGEQAHQGPESPQHFGAQLRAQFASKSHSCFYGQFNIALKSAYTVRANVSNPACVGAHRFRGCANDRARSRSTNLASPGALAFE